MMGYINNICDTKDELKIYHADKVSSIVDYDDAFMLHLIETKFIQFIIMDKV